ncbi:MAG: response regulator [Anaerolineales bacterium]|nr:response regulator [Anaerolineales bacterium]
MASDDDKIRVLIVGDVAETRENIRKLLQFEGDLEVVGAEGSGRAGIEASKALKPDVVLMDINMPDMDGITATELIRKQNAATQIVILSVQGDPNYMRRAMLAGARDFLTKPPALDELTSAIRRAGKMAHDERAKVAALPGLLGGAGGAGGAALGLGKTIVVYGPKGGNGATTIAVNLAVALKNEETPIALVDANLQFGDIAVFLNEQVRNTVLDLAPRADELDVEVVQNVMINHAPTGIKILAAPVRPEYAENVSGDQFGQLLKFLRTMFAYVIIDASSTLTDVVLSAMESCDILILVTTQEIPAIKNARLFLDLVNVLGIDRKRIILTMNRFDKRIGITPEKIGESFKHEVSVVIPFEDRVVVPSVNRGVPFMLGDRTRPIARSILMLAEKVRTRLTELAQQTEEKAAASGKK